MAKAIINHIIDREELLGAHRDYSAYTKINAEQNEQMKKEEELKRIWKEGDRNLSEEDKLLRDLLAELL